MSIRKLREYEAAVIGKLVAILESKQLTVVKRDNDRKWLESRNLNYLDMYHEPDRFIKKVFFGNKVEVYSNTSTDQGDMNVYIDGKHVERVSLSNKTAELNKLVFLSYSLSDGCHILTLEPCECDTEINVSKLVASDVSEAGSTSEFEFVGIDTETKGNWIGKYGSQGYDIVNYDTKVQGTSRR